MNIIEINPKEITKVSSISGCVLTRKERISIQGLIWKNETLTGNWDIPINRNINKSISYRDYLLFKANKQSVYDWKALINSIKTSGYTKVSDNYVEVALGRTGEYLLVDGRHRLIIAQELNISKIPVKVVYSHPEINSPFIPEPVYNRIQEKWNKNTIIYHTYATIKQRYNLVKKYLPLLQGLNVLEIGANSGMMMWSIMKYASTLIELEKQEKYFQQCIITKDELHQTNVQVINKSLQTLTQINELCIDALYASFVLYHLNHQEIDILKTQILPKCKVVIIPNRQMERKSRVNQYYLNRDIEIKKLLEFFAFKVQIDNTFQQGFSVIIGQK